MGCDLLLKCCVVLHVYICVVCSGRVALSRLLYFVFFFSSRRRHTRCLSDWSSDVCSSDLPAVDVAEDAEAQLRVGVEDLALRHVVTQVPGDERVILQRVLDQTAEALAPGRAGIGGEDVVGGRRERLEGVGHGSLLPGTRARTRLPP